MWRRLQWGGLGMIEYHDTTPRQLCCAKDARSSRAVIVLLIASSAWSGCGTQDGSRATTNPAVRDSSGVRVIENAVPSWPDRAGWYLDAIPEVIIGSAPAAMNSADAVRGSEMVPLSGVGDIDVLSDGRIVVADPAPAEITIFDSTGVLLARFGGRGDGPGELSTVRAVHVCDGDSLVAVNGPYLDTFDDQGGFMQRVRSRRPGQPAQIHAISSDCARVFRVGYANIPPEAESGTYDLAMVWTDLISGDVVDSMDASGVMEGWTRELYGTIRPWYIPWGTSERSVTAGAGEVVVGHGRVPELLRYDSAGQLKSIVRWRDQPDPVTSADRGRYSAARESWLARMPDDPEIRFHFPALDEYPRLPTHKPVFDRVLLDDMGGVWVLVFPAESFGAFDVRPVLSLEGPAAQTWTVFDSVGVWLGDVTLPPRFDLQVVARGRVYGVLKDSFDVESVQVYRLHRDLR